MPDSSAFLFPEDWAEQLRADPELSPVFPYPQDIAKRITWARANGGAFVHFSDDEGRTWQDSTALDTAPYSGGYGMRGGVQLPNGEILLPLSDVPKYEKVFLMRSSDGGRTWHKPSLVAYKEGLFFEEPSLLRLSDGTLLMLLRENTTHYLYQTDSDDDGYTWRPVFKRRFGVIHLTYFSCPMNGFCVSMAIGVSHMAFELLSVRIMGRLGRNMGFGCFAAIFPMGI